ncbi:DOPA-like domain containing protein [Amanita muscaria]
MYPDPLAGYDATPPLPDTLNPDGKSLYNPPSDCLSSAYERFPSPISPNKNGFDFHIYYIPSAPAEFEYARKLHERIRREFPELRIYKFWEKSVGPHPTAMFEVNTFTPHQTGAFFSWLAVHRGPCSVLIHPNTGDAIKDHTELATWMGKEWPVNLEAFKRHH